MVVDKSGFDALMGHAHSIYTADKMSVVILSELSLDLGTRIHCTVSLLIFGFSLDSTHVGRTMSLFLWWLHTMRRNMPTLVGMFSTRYRMLYRVRSGILDGDSI